MEAECVSDDCFWEFLGFDPIRVQVQTKPITVEQFHVRLQGQSELVQRRLGDGEKGFLVIDASESTRPQPEIRKLQAQWLSDNHEALQQTLVGMAFVIKERVVRGALTAIFWMTKNPVPYTVHATLEEALAHAAQACRRAGVELPPGLDDAPAQAVREALVAHRASIPR